MNEWVYLQAVFRWSQQFFATISIRFLLFSQLLSEWVWFADKNGTRVRFSSFLVHAGTLHQIQIVHIIWMHWTAPTSQPQLFCHFKCNCNDFICFWVLCRVWCTVYLLVLFLLSIVYVLDTQTCVCVYFWYVFILNCVSSDNKKARSSCQLKVDVELHVNICVWWLEKALPVGNALNK